MNITSLRSTTRSFLLTGTLTAVVSWMVTNLNESQGVEPKPKKTVTTKGAIEAGVMYDPSDLEVRLSDDFNKDYPPPHQLDMTRWISWKGVPRTHRGQCILTTQPRDDTNFSGIATRELSFNPGLAGTNGMEVDLVGYTSPGASSAELRKSGDSRLALAWGLTLGSWHGLIGGPTDKDRGVQLHIDLILPNGLYVYLVRTVLPEDMEKYPRDAYGPGAPPELNDKQRRDLHEEMAEREKVFISLPCLSLVCRAYRTEEEIKEILGRSRRWGLYLSDDANTVYWTLDGKVMDRVDITGYFSSSPESIRKGAHLTVTALGSDTCTIDDLVIYSSRADQAR